MSNQDESIEVTDDVETCDCCHCEVDDGVTFCSECQSDEYEADERDYREMELGEMAREDRRE